MLAVRAVNERVICLLRSRGRSQLGENPGPVRAGRGLGPLPRVAGVGCAV